MDWDFYLPGHLSSFYGGFDSCVLSSGLYHFRDCYYSHGSRTDLSHRGLSLAVAPISYYYVYTLLLQASVFLLLDLLLWLRVACFWLLTVGFWGFTLFFACACFLFMICVIYFMRWMKHFLFCGIHLRFRVRDLFFLSDSGCNFVLIVLGRVSFLPISTSICAQAYPLFPIVASRTVVQRIHGSKAQMLIPNTRVSGVCPRTTTNTNDGFYDTTS